MNRHLKYFLTGMVVLTIEFGVLYLAFKTNIGPLIIAGILLSVGSYLMGMAMYRGK